MPSIFVDTTTIQPDGSGTSRYAKSLSAELYARNSLVVPDGKLLTGSYDVHSGIKNPHFALNYEWIANRTHIQADASVFPNYFMPYGWPYPAAVTIHDVSFISHPHFYSRKMRLYYKARIKHTLKHADFILTVSEASKRAIIEHLGVKQDRILVHAPSTPPQPVKPVPRAERPYLLYIGNLEPKKNILNLIKGFNLLGNNTDYKLLLAGKLHGSKEWNKKAADIISSSQNVIWDGYVSDEKLNDYIKYASGITLMSHIEGFGLPVMDALSMNIPVLISTDPALAEVSGDFGICANPDNPNEIAAGLEQLMCKGQLKDADTFINSRYGFSAYKTGVSEIIDRLLKPKRHVFPSDLVNQSQSEIKGTPEEKAILGSIAYASVFKSGIHTDKLKYAISYPIRGKKHFHTVLSGLIRKHHRVLSMQKRTVYSNHILKNANHSKDFDSRITETEYIRKKHRNVLRMLLILPFIKGLYYSGGTVHNNGLYSDPDLDLLVITRKNCAWIGYAFLRIISRLYGKSESLCANYIIDEQYQGVHWQQDYYTAFQLLFLKKIALKSGVKHIRSQNGWIYDFFPNHPKFCTSFKNESKENLSFLAVLNLIIMFTWSRLWTAKGYKSGNGGLLWDAHRIKLHTNDHRPKVSGHFIKISHRLLSGKSNEPAEEVGQQA